VLIAVPVATAATGNMFILSLCTRIAIMAIAAVGLQTGGGLRQHDQPGPRAVRGSGGLHAGHLHALRARLRSAGNGLLQLPLVIVATAIVAWATGYVSLRMQGIYFLMITLAFSQMFHLLAVSVPTFGGDDGMTLYTRPWLPLIDLDSPYQRYALCAVPWFWPCWAWLGWCKSRFGLALRASAYNEPRLQSSGYDVHKVRLVAYVIAGVVAGLAGYLLALHTEFVSPSTMHWTRSGDLVIMIVLGGAA
jgi:branched-chain amino acid transport system permease protein